MIYKMIKYLGLSSSALILLTACGGGGSTAGTTIDTTTGTTPTYSVSGTAQKGPLIFGSNVWVAELDNQLNTTGDIHLTETTDDLGNFEVGSNINTRLIEILADGYYMDETTGNLSSGTISLSAIADLSVDTTPTVNILTTIQAPRLKTLLDSMDYKAALVQSEREVLSVFGIDSSKIDNLNGLFTMQINGSNDADSVLLATSAIMMQMATTQAASTSASKAAELTYFISDIASDISFDGVLDDATIQSKLNAAKANVNLADVKSNVETYYSDKGISITAPKFEEWVDKDGSGLLPRRQLALSGISFSNVTNVEAIQTTTSNPSTISGAGAGTYVYVDSSISGSIIKNGSAVSGAYTTAVDGDTIAYKLTSSSFGQNTSLTGKIGSNSITWNVTTRTPTIRYKSVDGNFPFPNASIPGDDPEIYHAFPLLITEDFIAKYVGSSFAINDYMGTSPLEKISIYSDNSDSPGTELISTTNFNSDYFGSNDLQKTDGTTQTSLSSLRSEAYLGSSGISLSAGDKIWVVYKFTSAKDFGSQGNAQVGFSARKVSSDGSTWSNYQGLANGRSSDLMPMVLLTD